MKVEDRQTDTERRSAERGRGRDDIALTLAVVPVAIPAGEYTVSSRRGRKVTRFGRDIYELPCVVREHPEYAGVELMHYVALPVWRPRARRYAPLSPRSKLAREIYIARFGQWPSRRDGLSPRALDEHQYRARVVVPTTDHTHAEIPAGLRVPVVVDLLERLA